MKRWVQVYKDTSIKNKLLLLFLIQIILPLVIIAFLFYQRSANIVKVQSLEMSQDMLKIMETRIEDFTSNVEIASQDLLYDQIIYDVLKGEQVDEFSFYEDVVELKNEMRKVTLSRKEVKSITLSNRAGEYFAYDIESGRYSEDHTLPYVTMLDKARKHDGRPVWHVQYVDDQTFVYLVRLINDRDDYTEIGMMAILVNMDELEISNQKLESDLFKSIGIVSEDKHLIYSLGEDYDSVFESLTFEGKDLYGMFEDLENEDSLVSYRTIEKTDWTVVTLFSKSEILSEIEQLKVWAVFLFAPTILLLSVLSFNTAVDIVNPIYRLIDAMKHLKEDNKSIHLETDRNDEMGELVNDFNDMSSEIEHLVKNIYQEQLTRKEIELKALQAQINPHFLFNTLETINWRAQLKGAPEISKMVTSLSSIMEASMGRDNKLVSLKEEFRYVENYLNIMLHRYEGRLSYETDIDPGVFFVKVPKLLLQPIVENAIEHGIGKTTIEGVIKTTAKVEGDQVLVIVEDNGKGISKLDLDELNDVLSMKSDEYYQNLKSMNKPSIGLHNVNQRIKLFYGDHYGITVESDEDKYTKVYLKLPKEAKKKGETDV